MDKNLELAKEVLGKVEVMLEGQDYKSIKHLLSSYFNLIRVSIMNKPPKHLNVEEFTYFTGFKDVLSKYYQTSQDLLEQELELNKFQEVNALTYVIGDLKRAIRDIDDQVRFKKKSRQLTQKIDIYTEN